MLQACRVLSPVRGLVSFRQSVIYRVSVSPLSTSCMVMQTTDLQDQLGNIKPQEQLGNVKPEQIIKDKKVNSGAISMEGDKGFEELKARVIKLRIAQLDLLKQKLGDDFMIENPADILPSVLKKPFSCGKCGKTYKTKANLMRHEATACGSIKPEEVFAPRPVVEHKCEGCGKIYKHESSLTKHKKTSLTCSASEMVSSEGSRAMPSPKPVELFQCETCHKEFKTKQGLTSHNNKSKTCGKAANEISAEEEALRIEEYNKAEANRIEENMKAARVVEVEEKREILVAYFDTLVNTGRTVAAIEEFRLIKNNADGREFTESILLYDKLLRGVARKNDLGKIQELWKDIIVSGLQPSLDSFISVMISFHNTDSSKNVFKTIFKQVYGDFTAAGYTIGQALNEGDFQFDDKKRLMEVVSTFLDPETLATAKQEEVVQDLVADIDRLGSANLASQVESVMAREEFDPLLTKQLEMEMSQLVKIPSISASYNKKTEQFREFTSSLESNWRERVSRTLDRKMSSRRKLPIYLRGTTINMQQFMTCVPLEQLTDIIIAAVKNNINSENFSLPVSHIIKTLGEEVMTTYHSNLKTNDTTTNFSDYTSSLSRYHDWYCKPQGGSATHREAIHSVTKELSLDQTFTMWPRSVRQALGSEMFQVMFREILIDRDREGHVISDGKVIDADGNYSSPLEPVNTCPAFFKVFRKRKGNMDIEELKPHPSLTAVFDINSLVDLEFPAKDLPMLVPPKPWISHTSGAYLIQDTKLIKVSEASAAAHESLVESLPPGGLNPILDSINQLSAVPWIVNKPVLELAGKLFMDQSDKELLSKAVLPLHPDNVSAPELSQGLQEVLANRASLTTEQVDEYRRYLHSKSLQTQIKSETYSLWCSALYRLSLAKHFQDDVLWFPHNIDFRGRCYPIPSQLNHMGADLARSLLIFAKGKKLGKDGLSWLKLHCINLTGTMKRESVAARLKHAEAILPNILQSATSPLEGERWWLESDDPWQTYSVCVEIKKALEHPGGPEDYTSHLPLHQDGSCNGLQHYAALGRDKLGARSVNLVPADVPQDVYSEIAAIVDRKREEDSQAGNEIAKTLEGFIKRKVVKQTVMTTVYGVTKYGATLQIAKQLKDLPDYPMDHVDLASKYLSHKTFESLNEMFTASQEIQNWFTECAMIISKDCYSNVSWVTPLGFPVIQPYNKMEEKKENKVTLQMTNMFKQARNVSAKEETRVKVNTVRNKNGFAPNFIHSLDSSHMMLTSMDLWSKGVTFASVHDCFWTHAADVEIMNKACRDQFISLHSSPILENLSTHFLKKFVIVPDSLLEKKLREETLARKLQARDMERKKREMLFKNLPRKGELDLGVINDSVYFFS